MLNFAAVMLQTMPALLFAGIARAFAPRPDRPLRLLFLLPLAGVLATIPAVVVEQLAFDSLSLKQRLSHILIKATIAAVPEETSKALFLAWFLRRRAAPAQRSEWLLYGIFLGLGFSFIEHLLNGASASPGSMVLRAIISVPGHALYTGIVASFAARKRFDGGAGVAVGLAIAILLHFAFDASGLAIQLFDGESRTVATFALRALQGAITYSGLAWLLLEGRGARERDVADARERESSEVPGALATGLSAS
jgi:RsiW-degrading membrane proteinase PrsW (M82 family)